MEESGLFPVFEVPDFIVDDATEEQGYKRSVFWDVEQGDFVLDDTNRMIKAKEENAYIQWCYKSAMTERYSLLGYPEELGIELEEAMEQDSQEAVESCLERTITEALMIHPCTQYVRDFSFEWNGDSVYCSFTVKGNDMDEEQIKVNVGGGRN